MVGHDNECMHENLALVFKQAMIKNEHSRFFGKNEALARAKDYKVSCAGFLNVREISAVKGRHRRTKAKIMARSRPPAALKTFPNAGEGACAPRVIRSLRVSSSVRL